MSGNSRGSISAEQISETGSKAESHGKTGQIHSPEQTGIFILFRDTSMGAEEKQNGQRRIYDSDSLG